MGTLEMIQQKAFLGKEFLTWLWYRADINPAIDIVGPRQAAKRQCEVEFMETMLLEASYGDARSSALKGDSPSTAPEAAAALMEGKKVRRAKIKFAHDGMDWIGTIDGETMNIHGLKLPPVGKLPFDETLGLRMESIIEFESLLGDLFSDFLVMRLDDKHWRKELKQIQAWVAEKVPA